ncbi:hypothetical protein J422_05628 [Methanocaldococcus villosus KIN24-T80]|uniref:Uncharacterized protein n=1 Tax=Methanocaldococcus villosus KIN24-T80 TaxID=1069083 RepID=N6V0K3_9EURY|nr:hypothetical protein [Methanocaldococcus villosus]ENN95848.1 hypothetical protein J422_05628 [Methanocaldococcus villosus KIN24-T80]
MNLIDLSIILILIVIVVMVIVVLKLKRIKKNLKIKARRMKWEKESTEIKLLKEIKKSMKCDEISNESFNNFIKKLEDNTYDDKLLKRK